MLLPIGLRADEWTQYGTVTSVMYYDDGTVHIWADMPRVDPGACGGNRYIIPSTNTNKKEAYASLLLAFATGSPVRLYVWTTPCTSGNPSIRAVQVAQ